MVNYNSSKMEVAIVTSPVTKQAVDLYLELVGMATKLEDSRCSNLKQYVNETTNYWKQKLNDKISRWPIILLLFTYHVLCIVSSHR